jgi:hypothetical protein
LLDNQISDAAIPTVLKLLERMNGKDDTNDAIGLVELRLHGNHFSRTFEDLLAHAIKDVELNGRYFR